MAKTVIVSYRGPAAPAVTAKSAPGGVQAGLDRLYRNAPPGDVAWMFADGNDLCMVEGDEPRKLISIDPEVVAAHYRGMSNGVLWPITHDRHDHVCLSAHHEPYRQFNAVVAKQLAATTTLGDWVTIQDYQFALVPSLLRELAPHIRSSLFWHIPWPEVVPAEVLDTMKMVARGLLGATVLGFHTREYRRNFVSFVREHLSEFFAYSYFVDNQATRHSTRIVVQPLGIDYDYWSELAKGPLVVPGLPTVPFVLSVERLDYSKGVFERFKAIDTFFELHPHRRGKMSFVQVAAKTRSEVEAFAQYWHDCQALEAYLSQKWGTSSWQPLVWLKEPIPPCELAPLYREASVIAIGPRRDGLNLVASEAVATADEENPSVICLSPFAGIWEQFGVSAWDQIGVSQWEAFGASQWELFGVPQWQQISLSLWKQFGAPVWEQFGARPWNQTVQGVVELDPTMPEQMAEAFEFALAMPLPERRRRIGWLKQQVRQNPLDRWVETMCQDPNR
jgi:trehalose 6-phosphate synthase